MTRASAEPAMVSAAKVAAEHSCHILRQAVDVRGLQNSKIKKLKLNFDTPPSPSRGGVRGGGIQKDELLAGAKRTRRLCRRKHSTFAKLFTPPLTPPRQGDGDSIKCRLRKPDVGISGQ